MTLAIQKQPRKQQLSYHEVLTKKIDIFDLGNLVSGPVQPILKVHLLNKIENVENYIGNKFVTYIVHFNVNYRFIFYF